MTYNPSVSHRELQKNYRIVPLSPTELQTEYNPSVSHRELQNNYGIVPHSPTGLPTELPTYNTDRITDGLRTSRSARTSDTCPSAHIPTDYAHPEAHARLTRVRLHTYRRLYRRLLPTESPTDLRTSRSARMCDMCPSARIPMDFSTDRKVWRDFQIFLGAQFN